MPEIPLHQQVAERIRRRVSGGEEGYRPGNKLRTYRELAEVEGVGETTMKLALRALVDQGVLTVRQGSGSFVRQPPATRDTDRTWYRRGGRSSHKAAQRAAGHTPRVTCDSTVQPAPDDIAGRLGIAPGAETMRSILGFFADDQPTHISTSWEPRDITGGTPVELPEEGPYGEWGVIDRMDVIGWRCEYVIEKCVARPASVAEAGLLRVRPGAPVIEIERTHYAVKDGAERAVETATIVAPEGARMIYRVPVRDAE